MHGQSDAPRFLVDENAARLVRWLRLLGYDTVRVPGADDADLVALAGREHRVLLTRDRGILVRRPIALGEVRALHLDSDDPWQQLAQVVRACHLDPKAPCSRVVLPATACWSQQRWRRRALTFRPSWRRRSGSLRAVPAAAATTGAAPTGAA